MKVRKQWLRVAAVGVILGVLAGCSTTTTSGGDPSGGGDPNTGVGLCRYDPTGKAAKDVDLPPSDPSFTDDSALKMTLHMDAGDVIIQLDPSVAPCAVNSLTSLVTQGYLDDTNCHRLAPGFVLQCGDPTETGSGGPGYRFDDELSGKETYTYGTVAMANSGANTNGSQFFIVLAPNAGLPPNYVVLGSVEPGSMTVVESIAEQGIDPNDIYADYNGGRPAEGGHIQSASLG
ncbi:MAG: peptidylprolyl isomerase [Propionibacteriaceae bacterium]|jgi:peptidyl-prolyl cis-trans isomerase B (cyclophilin B)|nr:peptidylprolyl isomerase [Propionibacteriaceae bacterium]